MHATQQFRRYNSCGRCDLACTCGKSKAILDVQRSKTDYQCTNEPTKVDTRQRRSAIEHDEDECKQANVQGGKFLNAHDSAPVEGSKI